MKYVYSAIIKNDADGAFYVSFPDLSGCFTDGNSLPEALENAADVLNLTLCSMDERGEKIPSPTPMKNIEVDANEFLTLIEADTVAYQAHYSGKTVKKTLSVPAYLNTLAERAHINFSETLRDALKKRLNI